LRDVPDDPDQLELSPTGPPDEIGPALQRDGHTVLFGTCSWTDKTLTHETDWYPKKTMSAEDRLRFYAAHFPLVEVDSTYYRPVTESQAQGWAERSPDGFRLDVKAYSLLTGHPTQVQSLWRDVREQLDPDDREKRNVYAKHLPPDALDEAWRRFSEALEPLRAAGKLGAILFQYPPWFGPRRDSREELRALRDRLPDDPICVELRSPRWTAETSDRERTLALLEELHLAFVSVDAPAASGLPRLMTATTPELAVVRFHGRDDAAWKNTSGSAADRFRYDYSDDELRELAKPATRLAEQAHETHLLMNNCYRDFAVRNADRFRELLARG
jgi:uncharacterized protein YecE (DUF72 family)